MKTIVLMMLLAVILPLSMLAQQDSMLLKRYYHAWVYPVQGRQVRHGALFEVRDSSILLTNSAKKKALLAGNFVVSEIYSYDIHKVLVQTSGKYGLGKKIGVSSGLLAGILIGASQYSKWNDHYALETSDGRTLENTIEAFGFVLIACVSTATGFLIGNIADQLAKKRILIEGDQEWFDGVRPQLKQLSLHEITGDSPEALKYVKRLPDSLTDIDGNRYSVIALGGMVWMGENLRVTRYRNGDTIPLVSGNDHWRQLTTGACCNAIDHLSAVKKYGRLYNRPAVLDPRDICPEGWLIPSFEEWQSLITFFGGVNQAGAGLKGSGTKTEFTNLAGYRESNGYKIRPGGAGMYWWADHPSNERIFGLTVSNKSTNVNYIDKERGMNMGMSVRCIKDVQLK